MMSGIKKIPASIRGSLFRKLQIIPIWLLNSISESRAVIQKIESIPLSEQVTEQVKRRHKIIEFCNTPRSTSEIMDHLGLKHREYFRSEILQPMLTEGILAQTMPDTPKSPKQKYISLT